jgi:murein DD-endopeptidase MepM/ murein hydrolase activator NlpD
MIFSCELDSISNTYASEKEKPSSALYKTKIRTSSKIEKYMSPLISDGFDFPVGNKNNNGPYKGRYGFQRKGWTITCNHCGKEKYGIHTGEVWDAIENRNTDLNEYVFAISTGVVYKIEHSKSNNGKAIMLEHVFLTNGKLDTIYSIYKHMNPEGLKNEIGIGDTIQKGDVIGSIGHIKDSIPTYLHIELRRKAISDQPIFIDYNNKPDNWIATNFKEVSKFISTHRKLISPSKTSKLFIAIKSKYKLYTIVNGKINDTTEIALGQDPKMHKIRQGDNRTPEGEYKFIQKAKGPFPGAVGPYFGPRWIRINYPNLYDAEIGLKNGIISEVEKAKIQSAIRKDEQPPKNTGIGGGIGIHGWSGEWDPSGHRNLTWGCISVNNSDLLPLYNLIQLGDLIIISE